MYNNAMASSTVLLSLDADVIDPLRLRACAQQRAAVYHRGSDITSSYGACAAEVLIISAPGPPAESYGVELAAYDTTQLATSTYGPRSLFRPVSSWQITVTVNILNRQLLRTYATRRFATCWRPRQAFAGHDEQAVYEALIGSSEGPPPNHYGVRLRRWSATTV
jgi:hypothetical protein